MAATNAQALGAQIEKLRGEPLQKMWLLQQTLFDELSGTDKDIVSSRPERIPLAILSGGKARVWNPDGGDMGRGSGPTIGFGNLAPVYRNYNMEWTILSNIATNSREKSAVDYLDFTLTNGMDQFKSNLDSELSWGDATGTLGTVVAYTANALFVQVDNPNRFYDGQDIDYTTAIGTAPTSTVTVNTVDAPNGLLYLNAAPATAFAAGGLFLQNNSSGLANSGIAGPLAYNVNGNTGTFLGITKATYPGKFSTPYVNANNNTITPAMARLLLNQMRVAMGSDNTPDAGYFFHMNYDQSAAWENTGLNVTQITQPGSSATGRDTLPSTAVATIGGIRILENPKAIKGRIDLLAKKYWFRQEIQPLDFFELDGKTVFPIYGTSGAPAALGWSSLVWGGNFGCTQPRRQAFMANLALPSGY